MAARHEPEVLRAGARQVARELGARLLELGFTAREVAGMARAAERDALVFTKVGNRSKSSS